MTLRIKSSDFSCFAGMRHHPSENKELDEYIKIFKENANLTAFLIEDKSGNMDFDVVCYCREQLKNGYGMSTRVEYDDDGKIKGYWLCFWKEES